MINQTSSGMVCMPNQLGIAYQKPKSSESVPHMWQNMCPPPKKNMCAYGCGNMVTRSCYDVPISQKNQVGIQMKPDQRQIHNTLATPGGVNLEQWKQQKKSNSTPTQMVYMGSQQQLYKTECDSHPRSCAPMSHPGVCAPSIGYNGNWIVMGEDTGVPATGPQGEEGRQGPMGPTGPTGPTGSRGEAGARVPMYSQGVIEMEESKSGIENEQIGSSVGLLVSFEEGMISKERIEDRQRIPFTDQLGERAPKDYKLNEEGSVVFRRDGTYLVIVTMQVSREDEGKCGVCINGKCQAVFEKEGKGHIMASLEINREDILSIELLEQGEIWLGGKEKDSTLPTLTVSCARIN